jgi:hypothetical protein
MFKQFLHKTANILKNGFFHKNASTNTSIMHKSSGLLLHDIFKEGGQQKETIGDYKIDKELSNHNQQVYHNPDTGKTLFNVSGTHNLKDVGTDIYHAFGNLKKTSRFKEAKNTYDIAKQKYGDNIDSTGYSLGGSVIGYIGDRDRTTTYNKGVTIGQINREKDAYRTAGDLVSISNTNNIKTLPNNNKKTGSALLDGLNSHWLSNIK